MLFLHTDDGNDILILTTLRRFPNILQNWFKGKTNVPQHFPKFFEDFQTLLKTSKEGPKIIRSYTNEFKYNLRDKLDISEIIDIFTSEDMENEPLESRM